MAWHRHAATQHSPLPSRCDGRAVAIHRLELLDAEHQTTVSGRAVPLGLGAVCDLLVADIRAGARGAIMQANRRCRRSCLPVTAATGSGPR